MSNPTSTSVLIPSWASIIIPPITSGMTDVATSETQQDEEGQDQVNVCMYVKGICEHIFLGAECDDDDPEHLTIYFHHISPSIAALELLQREPTHLFPIYGHPAQAYAWFNHGIHAYTKAIQDGARMPHVIAKIVAEYAVPSINRVWMVLDDQDEIRDDDNDNIRHLPLHPTGAIRSHIGGMGYLRPDEPHPICGECGWRMPLYLQLRLSDMPMETAMGYALSGIPIERQLLQCWGCPRDDQTAHSDGSLIPTPEMMARHGTGACIRIMDMGDATYATNVVQHITSDESKYRRYYHSGKEKEDITKPPPQLKLHLIKAWEEREATPLYEEWSNVMEDEYWGVREIVKETYYDDAERTGNTMGTKLGGYPYWDNGNFYQSCECGRYMQCVFQFHGMDEFEWGEGTTASIQQCPVHRQKFAFSWDCD